MELETAIWGASYILECTFALICASYVEAILSLSAKEWSRTGHFRLYLAGRNDSTEGARSDLQLSARVATSLDLFERCARGPFRLSCAPLVP